MRTLFRDADIILAPAVPFSAPRFDEEIVLMDGMPVPVRPTIGRFTQPLSLVGLPILVVPAWAPGRLPVGVQVVGPAYAEADVLRVGAALEAAGI